MERGTEVAPGALQNLVLSLGICLHVAECCGTVQGGGELEAWDLLT